MVDGHRIRIGKPGWFENVAGTWPAAEAVRQHDQGRTVALVEVDGKIAGLVAVTDSEKPGAADAVAALERMGIESVMLTGDSEPVARTIAGKVGGEQGFAEEVVVAPVVVEAR